MTNIFHWRFWKFTVKVFFILKICYWVLNNARGCNYTYKFHSNIHNKMDDNIGIALQHGTDFDIPKDRFCWIDMFISWFEDCQAWWFLFNLKLYASFKWKQKFVCLCLCSFSSSVAILAVCSYRVDGYVFCESPYSFFYL